MFLEVQGYGQSPTTPPAEQTSYRLPTVEADFKKLFSGGPLATMIVLMFIGGIFAQKKKRFTLSRKRGKWGIR